MVILPRAKAETRGGNRNTIRRGTPPRAIWEMYDEEKKKKKGRIRREKNSYCAKVKIKMERTRRVEGFGRYECTINGR